MSAQRKLFSTLSLARARLAIAPRPVTHTTRSRSRSIVTTSTLFRPSGGAAENVPESTKDESKTVPSEQITEEAKQAEPDAVEQVEKVSPALAIV